MDLDLRPIIAFQKGLAVFVDELKAAGYPEAGRAFQQIGEQLTPGPRAVPPASNGKKAAKVIPMRPTAPPDVGDTAGAAGVALGAAVVKAATKGKKRTAAAPLSSVEASILDALTPGAKLAMADLEAATGAKAPKLRLVLTELITAGKVDRTGEKRGTRYSRAATLENILSADTSEETTPETEETEEEVPAPKRKLKRKSNGASAAVLTNDIIEAVTDKLTVDDGILLGDLFEEMEKAGATYDAEQLQKYLAEMTERGIVDASDPSEDEEGEVFYYLAAGR